MTNPLRTLGAALLGAALTWSCGGGDLSPHDQDITFALDFSAQPPLAQGTQSAAAVAVVDEDFDDGPEELQPFDAAVDLRMVGPMPPGVHADFDRSPIRPGEAASMVVRADDDAQAGMHQLLVEGRIANSSTTRFFPHSAVVEASCADGTERIRDVFASRTSRTIAVTTSGSALLWGHNANPTPSTPPGRNSAVPRALAFYTAQRIDELGAVTSAASAGVVSAFVTAGGGELRLLTRHHRSDIRAPNGRAGWDIQQLPGASGFRDVVAGGTAFFARHEDGTVWRFGAPATESDVPFALSPPVRVDGLADVRVIAAGVDHLLALRFDGTVWAMGANDHGQLGTGDTQAAPQPVQVPGLSEIQHLAAGDGHSLAVRAGGTVLAWGRGDQGQLGHGFAGNALRPVEVVTAANNPIAGIIGVYAGSAHSLALENSGRVWSWGRGAEGQLGTGSTAGSSTAVRVDGVEVLKVAAAGGSSFTVESNAVGAWGDNGSGQLGDGTAQPRSRPVRALGLGRGEGRDCRQAPSSVVFSDGDFADHEWQAVVTAMPIDGPRQSSSRRAGDGNPAAMRFMRHEMGQGPATLEVFHQKLTAVYDPAAQGAIATIDYSEDHRLFAEFAQPNSDVGANIALRQGDRVFTQILTALPTVRENEWRTLTLTGLRRADFAQVSGPPCPPTQCPDFSASGQPITFGYRRLSAINELPSVTLFDHGIDNWRVTVHRAP